MADKALLQKWIEEFGLRVDVKNEAGAEMLRAALPDSNASSFLIQPKEGDLWSITHQRRIISSTVNEQWGGIDQAASPLVTLTKNVDRLANSFPLIESSVTKAGLDVVVKFSAALHCERLTKQCLALTLSLMIKAVKSFDLLVAQRAEQVAALAEYKARAAEPKKADEPEAKKQPAQTPAPSAGKTETKPAAERRCPKCGKVLTANTSFCSSCGSRVKVEEIEIPPSVALVMRRCRQCGHVIDSDKGFCPSCGTSLS